MGPFPFLVDSHCHLDYPDFEQDGVAKILERAKAENVGHFLTICVEIGKFPAVLSIAENFPNVHCTVGTHPHEAEKELNVTQDELITLAQHKKVVGIGETGLDYHYNHSPAAEQKKVFDTHIDAAVATGLPLIIHTREADTDTIDLLSAPRTQKPRGVMHCFSGGIEMARASLDLGFYISFSGIITFKKAEDLRDVVRYVPIDRLLVETDAPYLAPIPHRGARNEPAFVTHTAKMVCDIKGLPMEEVMQTTSKNFFTLFDKIKAI